MIKNAHTLFQISGLSAKPAAKSPARVNRCSFGCRLRTRTTANFGVGPPRQSGSVVLNRHTRTAIETIPLSHERVTTRSQASALLLEQIPRFRTASDTSTDPSQLSEASSRQETKTGHCHSRPKRRNEDRPKFSGESRELDTMQRGQD